jgi:hypothetical protein
MPTYSFSRTREQVRDMVLRKLGVLAAGESPSAEDSTIVYEAMDLRLKEMHANGTLWYRVSGAESDIALSVGNAAVSAASDVLYPVSMSIRVNGEDKPLHIIGHSQYRGIPRKSESGEPEAVFFSGGTFRFWPVPQQDYVGKVTYERVAADTQANTSPDIETSMLRALRNILVYDLADDFQEQNESKILRWKAEAEEARRTIAALNAERVDTATVQVEYF